MNDSKLKKGDRFCITRLSGQNDFQEDIHPRNNLPLHSFSPSQGICPEETNDNGAKLRLNPSFLTINVTSYVCKICMQWSRNFFARIISIRSGTSGSLIIFYFISTTVTRARCPMRWKNIKLIRKGWLDVMSLKNRYLSHSHGTGETASRTIKLRLSSFWMPIFFTSISHPEYIESRITAGVCRYIEYPRRRQVERRQYFHFKNDSPESVLSFVHCRRHPKPQTSNESAISIQSLAHFISVSFDKKKNLRTHHRGGMRKVKFNFPTNLSMLWKTRNDIGWPKSVFSFVLVW